MHRHRELADKVIGKISQSPLLEHERCNGVAVHPPQKLSSATA